MKSLFFQTAWSECEDVLSNFNEVQEFCDSNKATSITDLLDVAQKAVQKVSHTSSSSR